MGCGYLVTNYLLWIRVERIGFVNTVGKFELLKSRETLLLDQGLSGSQEGFAHAVNFVSWNPLKSGGGPTLENWRKKRMSKIILT